MAEYPPPEAPPIARDYLTVILYTQENRLRALEGLPPITLQEFLGTIQMLKG